MITLSDEILSSLYLNKNIMREIEIKEMFQEASSNDLGNQMFYSSQILYSSPSLFITKVGVKPTSKAGSFHIFNSNFVKFESTCFRQV